MSRLLASTHTALARAWAAALRHVRSVNTPEQVADRIRWHFGPDKLLDGLTEAITSFAAAEHSAYNAAAAAEARFVDADHISIRKKLLNFDPGDTDVLTWAERNRLDLVTGLTFEQRSLIRAMLIRIEEEGTNPLVAAKDILDSIGLTPQQEAAVTSYRAALESRQYTAALNRELSSGNADRSIRAAREADRSLTTEQIDRAVAQYRQNAIRLRAETIARTEGLRIAHQGSDALYRQAIARGDIDVDRLVCEWLHSPRRTTRQPREFHQVMHGQQRPWGVPFVSGLGNELRFPCDPEAPAEETINCGCARTVRILPAKAA